jgi:hypothetical protein
MLGFLFGMLVRPHAGGPDGIPVRYGSEVDIPITWNDVYSVARRKQAIQDNPKPFRTKQPKVTIDDNDDATSHMRIQNETNIEVRLDRSVPLKLPYGTETVSQSSSTPTIGSGSSKPVDATFKGTRFALADVSTDDR